MSKNLIVFFLPPEKTINGGIISIFCLCRESRRFKTTHGSEVVLSVLPGYKSYKRNKYIDNDEYIFSFSELVKKYPKPKSLTLHIPEYSVLSTAKSLNKYMKFLSRVDNLHINILNQNIELMPKESDIAYLYKYSNNITQTTAHNRYCTQQVANRYAIPTHLFSTLLNHKLYKKIPFDRKLDQIVISNDHNPHKQAILRKLSKELPNFKQITVRNMSHSEYKELIKTSKYTITFGEGFDGYNVESVFSGTVPFAVYNDIFFPSKDYIDLTNIFSSYSEMQNKLIQNIKNLEKDTKTYNSTLNNNLSKINKSYTFKSYLYNIKKFYQKKYTYMPQKDTIYNFMTTALNQKDEIISRLESSDSKNSKKINKLNKEIISNHNTIKSITNSASWRYTAPLRKISDKIKRHK